jgi:hypothetical protein
VQSAKLISVLKIPKIQGNEVQNESNELPCRGCIAETATDGQIVDHEIRPRLGELHRETAEKRNTGLKCVECVGVVLHLMGGVYAVRLRGPLRICWLANRASPEEPAASGWIVTGTRLVRLPMGRRLGKQ